MKNQSNRGFTIIELMIVLIIIAIAAAVSGPLLSGFLPNRTADRLYQEIELDLRYARSQAVTTSAEISFEPLDQWKSGWQVINVASNQVLRERSHNLAAGTVNSADIDTGSPLTFDINGRTNADASIVINVPGCTGRRVRTLAVNRIGQIQITGETKCP